LKKTKGRGVDTELNENGKVQAQKLANKLRNESIGLIVSSNLTRAKQTAQYLFDNGVTAPFKVFLFFF